MSSMRDIASRAQTPEQKQEIIERLHALWLRNPDLRLGQLILNCFRTDFYYTEDFKLIDVLEQRYAELRQGVEQCTSQAHDGCS